MLESTLIAQTSVKIEDDIHNLNLAILSVEMNRPFTSRELDCLGTLAMNAEPLLRTIEALRGKCRRGCGHPPGHEPLRQCP